MTTKEPAVKAQGDPAFEPSLQYCLALARHVRAAFPVLLSRETWSAVAGSTAPDPSALAPQEIATKYLVPNVAGQARLSAVLEYPPSKWLLEQEMEARGVWLPAEAQADGSLPDVYQAALAQNLKGVCFSGGGIRSATFNLGILQALAARKKLGAIDYLSTVSGGGYIHQFLASWIACENLAKVEEQLMPLPGESTRTIWPDPIRWLRRYSNYLTPRKGLLTADTWVAVSVWLRNTLLNQIILLSTMLFVLLLPHVPLLWFFDPTSQTTSPVTGGLLPAVATAALFLFAAFHLVRAFPKGGERGERPANLPSASTTDSCDTQNGASGPERRIGYGGIRVFLLILLPTFAAIFIVSPFLYRSSFPGLIEKPDVTAAPIAPGIPMLVEQLHTLAAKPTAQPSAQPAAQPNAQANPEPPSFVDDIGALLHHYRGLPFWTPLDESLRFILIAFLCGQGFLVIALGAAVPTGSRRVGPVLAATVVAVGTALLLLHLARLILLIAAIALPYRALLSFTIVFAPLLLLAVIFISMDLAIGTTGRCMLDSRREWLARVRSLSFLSGFGWLAVVGCSLFGPVLMSELFHLHWKVLTAGAMSWAATSAASIFAGKSSSTNSPADSSKPTDSALEFLVRLGPPVFLIGLMLLLAWVVQLCINAMALSSFLSFFLAAGVLGFIALFFSWRVDINDFSMHSFYKDRIARCYSGASNPDRHANKFTGLATSDERLLLVDLLPARFGHGDASLWARPGVKPTYEGPFPIFSSTLNLTFGADLATQERKAAAFAFTPLFCGYDVGWTEGADLSVQFNGFAPTNGFAYPNGGPGLSTAVSASGAALNPNEGFHTSTAMAFLLTIFNARLGWWIPNPRNMQTGFLSRLSGATPVLGLPYLLRELFGQVSDDAPFVSVSDGGQFENMGLYELVRRRCRTIIICDAEADAGFVFEGLGMAIRKCRIDFGVEIVDLDLDKLVPGECGFSSCAYAEGKIIYPALDIPGDPNREPITGHVLYLKSAVTGGEPSDIRNYKREHPAFPSDSTLNQWFTESEFESYRRLGQWIGEGAAVRGWLEKYF
jgi:hypothetical protein